MSSCERDMEGFVAFKLHVSQWGKVSVHKTSVTLDGILTEAMYPQPLDVIVIVLGRPQLPYSIPLWTCMFGCH